MKDYLSDQPSLEVARKLENSGQKIVQVQEPRNNGTVGIAGHYPIQNSSLAIEFVKAGNDLGYKDDQQHPELVVINLAQKDKDDDSYLRDQIRMLADIGCDVIAVSENDLEEDQVKKLQLFAGRKIDIIVLGENESQYDLAKKTLQKLEDIPKIRPNIYDHRSYNQILENINRDVERRETRIGHRQMHDGGYPFIQHILEGQNNSVGVVGGAGPMASANYSLALANDNISHIHFSNNSAPYKIKFALKEGPSFLAHYKNTMHILQTLGCSQIAMPCNTAHLFLPIFKECQLLSNLGFIDIRESVPDFIKEKKLGDKFILLGTDATVGIDAQGNYYDGLYDELMRRDGIEIVKPNRRQQDIIMKAIFKSKAGEKEEARKDTEKVICEIQDQHKIQYSPILACTELPIAFGPNQLAKINAISTVVSFSNFTVKVLQEKRKSEDLESDISDNSSEISENSYEDILEKYDLSYCIEKVGNKIAKYKIYFNPKGGVKISADEIAEDLENFRNNFSSNEKSNRVHKYSKYISFNGEEVFDKLQKFINDNQIKQSQNQHSKL